MSQDPLDQLEELVSERYPKGTSDPFGRELRHQLHRLGRLNDPDPVSEHGFVVFFPSVAVPEEPNSGWDVVVVKTYDQALAVRGFGTTRVIRALEPHGVHLWAARVNDPRNRNGEAPKR